MNSSSISKEELRSPFLEGEKFIKKGRLREARFAYAKAGKKIPKDKIIECGDVWLRHGRMDIALDIYISAGVEQIPKYKLIECGNVWLQCGEIDTAFDIYKEAKDKAGLKECYYAYLESGQKHKARETRKIISLLK